MTIAQQQAARTRKPAAPVHGSCRWLLQPAGARPGMLSINGVAYLVEILRDASQPYAFRLSRQDLRHGAEYQLPTDLSSCDCPDAVYREDRPGGCKHRRALTVALSALGTPTASRDLSY